MATEQSWILSIPLGLILFNSVILFVAPTTAFPYDEIFLTDIAWRFASGQVPSTDFSSPFGFGVPYIASFFWGGGHDFRLPMIMAIGIVACVIVVATYALIRDLFSCPVVVLALSIIAVEASGPTVYGWGARAIGFSANYSRLSVAALAGLFIGALANHAERNSQRGMAVRGIAVSILLNCAFICKISAFVIGIGIWAAGLIIMIYQRQKFIIFSLVTGFSLAVFLGGDFALSHISPAALWEEYRLAAVVRAPYGINILSADPARFWQTIIVTILLLAFITRSRLVSSDHLMNVGIIGCFFVVQMMLNISNTQPETLYLLPVCALVLLSHAGHRATPAALDVAALEHRRVIRAMKYYPAHVVCGYFLMFHGLMSTVALLIGVVTMLGGFDSTTIVASARHVMTVADISGDDGRGMAYAKRVANGLLAIERAGIGRATIMTLDYANPFPYMLGYPPPRGVGVNISPGYLLPTEPAALSIYLWGDACALMRPREFVQVIENADDIVDRASAGPLRRNYHLVFADKDWEIYWLNSPSAIFDGPRHACARMGAR